jgi:hypothetical protein
MADLLFHELASVNAQLRVTLRIIYPSLIQEFKESVPAQFIKLIYSNSLLANILPKLLFT